MNPAADGTPIAISVTANSTHGGMWHTRDQTPTLLRSDPCRRDVSVRHHI
jgi:hypothetical protein